MVKETVKTLYLIDNDPELQAQLKGEQLTGFNSQNLINRVSTDAIIPSKYCFEDADPSRLGQYCLVGLPNQIIKPGDVKKTDIKRLVAGESFGRGSSREHAQLAIIGAGIQELVTKSSERIFFENCTNYGLPVYPLDHPMVQSALKNQEQLPQNVYFDQLPPISRLIAQAGGLLPFFRARIRGKIGSLLPEAVAPRPMTMVEKIIASHAGIDFVKPGQQLITKIDRGYFYELQSIVSTATLEKYFPDGYAIPRPENFIAFEDHLALLDNPKAEKLRLRQRQFTSKFNIPSYQVHPQIGVEGICHSVMASKHCLPGELILGNDSHTCTLGVNNAFAIGKGASEMAAAMVSGELVIRVPETIRFNLRSQLPEGVTAYDLALEILRRHEFKEGLMGSGKVFEFGGEGIGSLSSDEQLVLTNTAIEGQAFTGIIEYNSQTEEYLSRFRSLSRRLLRSLAVYSDPDSQYFQTLFIDLEKVEPMIALPGDTQNGIPLSALGKVEIDIAYIGSCTGGKLTDLIRAAKILEGKKVNPNVRLIIQASSQSILQQAETLGLTDVFKKAGAEVILPGCGACMGAGPGSSKEGQTILLNTNRNFHGRTGSGTAYLGSAITVAASALKGFITQP